MDARRRRQSWHTARHSPTPFATADGEAFLRVKAIDPLEVHEKALAPQQDVESSIAEPPPLANQRPQTVAQHRPVLPPRPVATGRAAEPDEGARPALAQLELGLDRPHRGPLRHGRQTFFPTSSLRAWSPISRSITRPSRSSSTRRFSRVFSCSRVRSRRASFTSRPVYLAFQP